MSFKEGDGDLWFDHYSEEYPGDPESKMATLSYLKDIRNLLKLLLEKKEKEEQDVD